MEQQLELMDQLNSWSLMDKRDGLLIPPPSMPADSTGTSQLATSKASLTSLKDQSSPQTTTTQNNLPAQELGLMDQTQSI